METLILTMDTIALMVVIYFSYRGEKLPGKPELGPFRIRTPAPLKQPDADGAASVPARTGSLTSPTTGRAARR